MARESTVPEKVVTEDIRSVEHLTGEYVRVMTGVVDTSGVFVVPQQFETFTIDGDNLVELLSEGPSWAPSKPAGTFRSEDLWLFVDRIREAS